MPPACVPAAAAAAAAASLVLAGCGDGGAGDPGARPTVSAAASLRAPLTRCAPDARLQFGGSSELAAQARRGAAPDVFAAASVAVARALADEGLVEAPVVVAGNELVVAVPARGERRVQRLGDLARPGVDVAVGARGVPAGDYARAALARLPAARRRAILANVRSEEPDVKGVVAKVARGAVDAGFVYASDVAAAAGALRPIRLPRALRPEVAFAAAVRRDAPPAARAVLASLRSGRCQAALRAAGFAPPAAAPAVEDATQGAAGKAGAR